MSQVARHQVTLFESAQQLLPSCRIGLASRRTLLQKSVGVNLIDRKKGQVRLHPIGQNLLRGRERRLPARVGIVCHKQQTLAPGPISSCVRGIAHNFIHHRLRLRLRRHRQAPNAHVQRLGSKIRPFVGVQITDEIVQTVGGVQGKTGRTLVNRYKILLARQSVFVVV